MKLPLRAILVDPSINIREDIDELTVAHYAEILEALPPVTVFGETNLLGDGFHRIDAAIRRGWTEIDVERRPGGRAEAEAFAVTANAKHGKPLTRDERDEGIRRLRQQGWGYDRIAKEMGIPSGTITDIIKAEKVETALRGVGIPTPSRSHLYQIADAPKEAQAPIARAAVEQSWPVNTTREVVRVARQDGPAAAEAAIERLAIERRSEQESGRDVAREHAERLRLGLRTAQDADAYLALLRLMEVFERADGFGPAVLAASVPSENVDTVMASMRRVAELASRVNDELSEGRKLKAVQ